VSRIRGTRRTRKDTEGHDGARKCVQEDTGGTGGTREDTGYVGFGTVRPRVEIPGPRPLSEYDPCVTLGAWLGAGSQPYHNFPKKCQRAEGIVEAYLALDAWRVAEFRIQASMLRDYQAWHDQCDDPNSALAERYGLFSCDWANS
jgi:hypothetical protein